MPAFLVEPRTLRQEREPPIKTILFWNSFHDRGDFGFGLGQSGFWECSCPITHCRTTNRRSDFPLADAVVFHTREKSFLRKPRAVPRRASPGQIYVFLNFEAPLRTGDHLRRFSDVFNLTLTYRKDSDIYVPAWKMERRARPEAVGINEAKIRNKTRPVAWFISSCDKTGSRRWEYAAELARHVQVDIYGDCGDLSCPKIRSDPNATRECFTRVGRRYRFYLAFENAFCQDYVTEKILIPWLFDMVPVVLGNFGKVILPHSALDVRDFRSPAALARHLRYLSDNDKEYATYFDFRKTYKPRGRSCDRGFCRLCEILHDPTYQYRSNFDVYRWWVEGGKCLNEDAVDKLLGLNWE